MSKKLTKEEFIRRVFETNRYVNDGLIEVFGEYNGLYEPIEYLCNRCGNVQHPIALSLLKGNGCKTCGKIQSGKTQSKSNNKFQDELISLRKNGHDIFCDDIYINNRTKISFYCSNGHTWKATPASILNGSGCPYCSNRMVLTGYNDIATTSPDIFKFLKNQEDGYKYTRFSNKRIDFKCVLCGHIQNRKINTVAHRGFKCECCGSGISYPNKFGRALFDQLPIEKYRTEYCPDWGKPYVYDIYFTLNNIEYIIELDGRQHVDTRNGFGIPLEEHRRIDDIKDRLAKENNVYLIRIDCSKSECNYIKNNILMSKLNSLFDLSLINWKLCDERAQNNLVKLTCDLWMSGIRSFDELSKRLHLGNSTVRDYIKRGANIGWCDYDSKQWIYDQCLPVHVVDITNNNEYFFKSIHECANATNSIRNHRIAEETIKKYCIKGIPYNGLLFEIIDSTIQN
jgi:DNA-directed RNA polymerase subunit RPC12/RpoP